MLTSNVLYLLVSRGQQRGEGGEIIAPSIIHLVRDFLFKFFFFLVWRHQTRIGRLGFHLKVRQEHRIFSSRNKALSLNQSVRVRTTQKHVPVVYSEKMNLMSLVNCLQTTRKSTIRNFSQLSSIQMEKAYVVEMCPVCTDR